MLEVFYEEFYGWGYIEFSKLDQNVRQVFKKTFMTKRIYISRLNSHVNQYIANLIIDK